MLLFSAHLVEACALVQYPAKWADAVDRDSPARGRGLEIRARERRETSGRLAGMLREAAAFGEAVGRAAGAPLGLLRGRRPGRGSARW
eukprot:48035-Pyramimonas_sp.AAC.1